jgi:ribosomal protein S18 acetylase RimI-like enzyme
VSVTVSVPSRDALVEAVRMLGTWQRDDAPVPLHPGDLGWHWRFGADTTAAAVRTWSREGRLLAVGLLDGPRLLRLAIAPEAWEDEELARRLVADVEDPAAGVLPPGEVAVEARTGALFGRLLLDHGWQLGEPWTPLSRDLAAPVPDAGLRIEVAGPPEAPVRVAVQRAAFATSTFTEEAWRAMAAGPAYGDARCLLGYDEQGVAVAAVTVWSAGPGRPGLLEPMGVHRDHRGRGHGRAITLAAAGALRELGSSTATVCTRAANVGGVATYAAAGMRRLADVRDLHRAG